MRLLILISVVVLLAGTALAQDRTPPAPELKAPSAADIKNIREERTKHLEEARKKLAEQMPETENTQVAISAAERANLASLNVALAQCIGAVKLQTNDQICQAVAKFITLLSDRVQMGVSPKKD